MSEENTVTIDITNILPNSSIQVFTTVNQDETVIDEESAQPYPYYNRLVDTSFITNLTLRKLNEELMRIFSKKSINYINYSKQIQNNFQCNALRSHAIVLFEISIHRNRYSEDELLVEICRLHGCPFAFSELSEEILSAIKSCK
jgi:hypothetical protein